MKISDIKPQVKRQGRYSIYVDQKYAFSLSESALLDHKLHIGQEVNPEQLVAYKDASKVDKAYSLALAYVARRMRSEWELRDYMRRKDYDEETTEFILRRLAGYGYVDDLAFARSWVENRRLLRAVSRRRLMQELRAKRVADDVVQVVLSEDETTDRHTLQKLIANKRRQSRYQDDTKLMQYLARQGYGYDDIKAAMASSEESHDY